MLCYAYSMLDVSSRLLNIVNRTKKAAAAVLLPYYPPPEPPQGRLRAG